MFFDCSITQNIWRDITFWVGYTRVSTGRNDERLWLIQETKNKGRRRQIIKIVTTETIYTIQRTRNYMIFIQHRIEPNVKYTIIFNIVMRDLDTMLSCVQLSSKHNLMREKKEKIILINSR